jgi:hypothetical protein
MQRSCITPPQQVITMTKSNQQAFNVSPRQSKIPQSELLSKIALDHCFVETLETQNSDRLDFHSISVWGLQSALNAAYQAGLQAG